MSDKNIYRLIRFSIVWCMAGCIVACGGGHSKEAQVPLATDLTNHDDPTVVAPPAAGGGAPPIEKMRQQIEQLEHSGIIPKLDRTETLAGIDANNDGVRDDVAAFIAELPLTGEQKRAFMQEARALQGTLFVDLNDKVAQQKSGDRTMAATHCSASRLPEVFYVVGQKIEAITFNTKLRMRQYMQYNAARSGSATSMPRYDSCE